MILWCYSGRFGVLFWTREGGRLLREVCTLLEHVDFSEKCVRFLNMSTFPSFGVRFLKMSRELWSSSGAYLLTIFPEKNFHIQALVTRRVH